MKIDETIFKAYDIRGVYPESLNEEVAERLGKALGQLLKKEKQKKDLRLVVSGDIRKSTPPLKKALVKGLIQQGVNVVDIGDVSTPTFYFTVAYWKYDGGVQITASHNPPDWNGFKMVRERAVPISGKSGIQELKKMIMANDFPTRDQKGTVEKKKDVLEKSIDEMTKTVALDSIKPLKIVVDPANAMASKYISRFFDRLPVQLVKMNWELDGSFPNHQPDPLIEENLIPLKKRVVDEKADLGIAPDGDGDRIFFIDEKGQTFRQDILRGIIAQIELSKHPGAKICYDIRPGKITKDMIEEAGGVPVLTKVGHTNIKESMIEEGAVFAGESSGHYYYQFDYGSFESPVRLIAEFLSYVSREGKPLSVISKPYEVYFQSGEINSKVPDVKTKIEEVKKHYADANKISELDGVTVEYDDFWFNVRGSNTQPLLRLNLEAVSKEMMEQKTKEILDIIRR